MPLPFQSIRDAFRRNRWHLVFQCTVNEKGHGCFYAVVRRRVGVQGPVRRNKRHYGRGKTTDGD